MESYLPYLTAKILIGIFRYVPRRLAVTLLQSLASLAYLVDRKHRHIARVNLAIAFPELSRDQHDRIARRSFQNTALNLLEVSRLDRLTRETIGEIVTYDPESGLENFLSASRTGRPLLYLTGHFSAWELLPAAHALYGYPLSFITRPLDNPSLENYLVRIRESPGNRVLSKRNSARQILERLKTGDSVGILLDQNTSLQEGAFVDFFGIPAATSTSLALFSLRTEAVVLPGYLTPIREGRYRIKFLAPIDPIRTGDMSRDVLDNTQLFSRVLEAIIREQPESWLWGHKRWKNQPPGNPQDLYALSDAELKGFLSAQRGRKEAPSDAGFETSPDRNDANKLESGGNDAEQH